MIRKLIIAGCLSGASFFVACQSQDQNEEQNNSTAEAPKKELKVHQESELALLMRSMYERNLDLREQIMQGEIPASFPEDFKRIHSAPASEELNETFDALALEYIRNMEGITAASDPVEARKAYNTMINTCASCHQIYCQGPLAKIKKMRIPAPGDES